VSGTPLDLRRRETLPELLDQDIPEADSIESLGDLRLVNRWLGGRSLIASVLPFLDAGSSLLDVGCGSADLPGRLLQARPRLFAVGTDIKLLHLKQAPQGILPVVADLRALPFPRDSFDVVTASLVLHHFNSPEIPSILSSLFALSRRALVLNDLHRSWVPYVFGRLTFPLLFASKVSVHDGLISIRRAFKPQELAAAFREAGISNVRIRRAFPYRLVAVAQK